MKSKWKLNYFNYMLLKKTKSFLLKSRSHIITSNLVGLPCFVHNGKNYFKVTITNNMIGKKLGSFSITRKRYKIYKKKIKKKNK